MHRRVTILCENSVGPVSGTLGEHGFSVLIEWDGGSLLFDTGQGFTLLHNAQRMNKNLHQVTEVALSHGHYDHSGGLLPLVRTCGPKTVYAHPAVFQERYRHKDTGESLSLGMPYPRSYLEGQGVTFNLAEGYREIVPGIFLTGSVPRRTAFELGDSGLFSDRCACTKDSFDDDQSLVIVSPKGLTVVLGCCHAGLINTLNYVSEVTGRSDIYAVIGGTHLGFCSAEQFEQTCAELSGRGIKRLAVSHCTGFMAACQLQRRFPQQFQNAAVGYTIEI